jgi:hypothetical protein
VEFRIQQDEVQALIKRRFGNVQGLEVALNERSPGEATSARSTIYRWLKSGVPKAPDALLEFCGALDVDPMAILDFEQSGTMRNFDKLRMSFQLGRELSSPMRVFKDLLFPGPFWPNDASVERCYGRPWFRVDFEHSAETLTNVYALLRIAPRDDDRTSPLVFHIAYRRKPAADHMWRPFGSIIRREASLTIASESGGLIERAIAPDGRIDVETFYGPGPAEFRIASLHAFDVEIVVPSPAKDALRFVG